MIMIRILKPSRDLKHSDDFYYFLIFKNMDLIFMQYIFKKCIRRKLENKMGIREHVRTQPNLLFYLDSLDDQRKDELTEHLLKFDFNQLSEAFKEARNPQLPKLKDIQPPNPENYVDREMLSAKELERLFDIGLKAVSEGKVAALVLAGGQASRLGSDRPKGVITLGTGFDSRTDSLLFIQASQIARTQQMARQRFPGSNSTITWLVMTSRTTDDDTRAHLDEVLKETGLNWDQVIVFTQNEIPAFDIEGQALLSSPTRLVTAPDGNGGIYDAIHPLIPILEQRRVQYFHVYCVDNILCRVPDVHMIGCAIDMGSDCAAKVVEKKDPTELVGHVCLEGGKVRVLEYSEISRDLAEQRDPLQPDKLLLRAGSIANHFFTLDFLRRACQLASSMPYHLANKRIAYLEPSSGQIIRPINPNGFKLERFIFDAFCRSDKFLCWQVPAAEEFSPLKNPDSVGRDCLSTCLRSLHGPNGQRIREACIAVVCQRKEEDGSGQSNQ